uniref:Uncharacterized protein n=1 Tax=Panagrolaimus sp. JU765 TaxID=591449 RepID=A0AC34QA08_9BILA
MSVEALLSEVTSTIVYAPIIAAAESHFYHDSRVLSDIKPETSHAGGHGGHHNHHGHAHGNQKGDKVANAIHEMKDAIHKAKKGGGRNRHGSQKSESNGDLSKLTQELEELKLGYQTLKNEVESLRKLVQGGAVSTSTTAAVPPKEEKPEATGGDDDFDLFGSEDEDDEEKKRITEERLKAYAEKKAKKPGPIAKSTIIYDIKPWDDTINIEDIEKAVRGIEMDGLVWGASKKMPVAFGINKLQISCVIEDDKVSSDSLEEAITGFEDLVQSVDIVAFNKV